MKKTLFLMLGLGVITCFSACDKSDKCVTNLKQVGLALHMYSNDNSDVFPAGLSELEDSYLMDISLTRCPADNTTYQYSGSGLNPYTSFSEVVVTCPVHNHKVMADGHVERGN